MSEKQHLRGSALASDNSCISLCGEVVQFGAWKSGAAYEGLRIVGTPADEFCAECCREWLKLRNQRDPS